MFKKTMSLALAALIAASAILSTAAPAEAGRRGARIAAGIALGLAAGAIIANSNRAHADDYYVSRRRGYYDDGGDVCRRWAWKCDHGNDWACEKFDRNC